MKKQIICLGQPAIDGDYLKSTIQLMEAMTDQYEVLYIEYTFTLIDLIKSIFVKSNVPTARLLRLKPALQQRTSGMYTFTLLPIIPYNWIRNERFFQLVLNWNTRLIARAIKRQQRKLNFSKPILINAFSPVFGNALHGKLDVEQTIYYCYDEISQAKWLKKHGTKAEQEFLKIVDKVVVSSRELLAQKAKLNPDTHLVPNGVDIELFQAEKYNPNPTKVGYIGTIDNRIDQKLLDRIFTENKDLTFEFVGRVMDKHIERKFENYPNVKFLGSVPPSQFQKYLSSWSVGLIPFVKNQFTKSIYPLKVNEYLCNGLAVLATEFTDLSEFGEMVKLINNKNSKAVLAAAIVPSANSIINQRKAFAAQNSWSCRANQLDQILKIS